MSIDIKAHYKSKVAVLGICPAGTALRVWTVKNKSNEAIQVVGHKDHTMLGFNLTSGGGVFFREKDVELA